LQSLPLHKQLLKALEKLAFTEATAVQEQAIPPALEGKDLMVSAQTGSGKTAAFLLPILQRMMTHEAPDSGTRVLILLPTRELALQTQKHFEQLAAFTYIKSGLIIGGEAFKHQVATLRKNPEVLIATPGRLVEHLERGTPDFKDLEILVLDEADRMLDMGFAIDMYTIAESCNKQRQNLLFSATLNHKELGRIKSTFKDPEFIEVDSHRQQHRHITQQLILADDNKHKETLVAALLNEEQTHKVFIFCKTRLQCQQLSNVLKYKKFKVGCIHGEIPQSDRKHIMNQFRQGGIEVLVATDLAARGLDINDVDLVINFSIAQSGDDHIHRIGRTGRAGKEGKAITIIDSYELNQMSSIERYLKIRFEHRVIQGLKAKYCGPKNIKKSGKAAGTKKKKIDTKKVSPKKSGTKKLTQKKANTAKAKRPKENSRQSGSGDGFDVLTKKK
jgi:superfamily II DNA/RNA helicase